MHDENPKEELVPTTLPPETAAANQRREHVAQLAAYLDWCLDHPEAHLPGGTILHPVATPSDIEPLILALGGDWKLTVDRTYAYARREVAPGITYQLYAPVATTGAHEHPVQSFTDLADA